MWSTIRAGLLATHRRLLPVSPALGWTPYLWLFYMTFFYWKYAFVPIAPIALEFAAALLTGPVFLYIYFNGHWVRGRRVLFNVAGMVVLAVIWVPVNMGALSFFIYGAAFLGMLGNMRDGWRGLLVIELIILAEWWLLGLHWVVPFFGGTIAALVAAVNLYYADLSRKNAQLKLSQEEVKQLAAMAERERIARDLHDLLGHTLSVITLKSELAVKYLERGDSRAETEIRDVERISREALSEVRDAVSGFRRSGLVGEVANAKLACEAIGIELKPELGEYVLRTETEAVLAMVLREAATNVVRHSGAERCEVSLHQDGARMVLTVRDDGRGGQIEFGSGLSGMKRRLETEGGGLTVDGGGGATITAWLPREADEHGDSATGVEVVA